MSPRMPEPRTSKDRKLDPSLDYSIRKEPARSTRLRMPDQNTSKDRKLHLYLAFDDWNSGYSICKVSLSRRSGKQPALSSDSGEDSEQPALSGQGKAVKPLPVFMRVPAMRGFPEYFTSAFGTKIMAMHPRSRDVDNFTGVPTIDVVDLTCTYEIEPNIAAAPIYIPVSDDRLFTLDIGSLEVLHKRGQTGQPWVWQKFTCPFDIWDVSSYGVQPDGCILVSTKTGVTFIFDTKEYVWKLYGHWVFPFTGRGHYDPSLKGFVGLSKDPETLGYLYCCTVTGDTGNTSLELKCTKDTVYNKNPDEGQHVSATLVHMRPGKFCLVECVSIGDNRSTDQEMDAQEFRAPPCIEPTYVSIGDNRSIDLRDGQEFRVLPWIDQEYTMGGGPQAGRFMYRLKTFSLINDMNRDLKLKHCKVYCYSLPYEARIGTVRQDPVAFWL